MRLDRQLKDRDVCRRIYQFERYPGAVVESPPDIFLGFNAMLFQQRNDSFCYFRIAGGRVGGVVKFIGKTTKIIDK